MLLENESNGGGMRYAECGMRSAEWEGVTLGINIYIGTRG